MITNISIYLYPDTIQFFNKDSHLVKRIENDTNTSLIINCCKFNPYITIEGKFENNHKARIILQEIEKNNYSKYEKTDKKFDQ